ncbi:MAG: hypothetical protein NVSMB3_11560 [Acidobacteriaceae bacterium]
MPSRFAAALIMPLTLGCLQAMAQMVPVESTSAAEPPSTIYSTAAVHDFAPSLPASGAYRASGGAGIQLPPPAKSHETPHFGPFTTTALGLTGGTLGEGAELATPLARRLNLRVRGSYFNFQYPFTIDGVNYNTAMKLTSGQGLIDWFPSGGGFHVSVGGLYFKNAVNAAASVAPGQQFKLGGTSYLNSVDDPVRGTATLTFPRKVAPMVLLGFGNLIPRSGRHLSVPFEFGGAYLKPPQVGLQLAGTACTMQGCFNTATDPSAIANVLQEENRLNRYIRPLQIYPILSLGLALRF